MENHVYNNFSDILTLVRPFTYYVTFYMGEGSLNHLKKLKESLEIFKKKREIAYPR